MLAKRNPLPKPCPKCQNNYGTIQLQYFRKSRSSRIQFVIRIGHYNSKGYQDIKRKTSNLNYSSIRTEDQLKKEIRTKQRRWCTFRTEHDSRLNHDDIRNYMLQAKKRALSVSPSIELIDFIKRRGWGHESERLFN